MKVEKVSVRQKIGVASTIFIVYFFFISLISGNFRTDRLGLTVLQLVIFIGGAIIIFWSLVLGAAFFSMREINVIAAGIAISGYLSFLIRESVKTTLGNIGIVACLVSSFLVGIFLLHSR